MLKSSYKAQIEREHEHADRRLSSQVQLKAGANPARTAELVSEILDIEGNIHSKKKGLITQAEAFRMACKEFKENIFAQVAGLRKENHQPMSLILLFFPSSYYNSVHRPFALELDL